MSRVVFNWLTACDIAAEQMADEFIALMAAYIPGHVPSVCGIVEPLSVPLYDTNQVRSLWQQSFFWRRAKGNVSGDVAHGRYWHSTVHHQYDVTLPVNEDPVGLLREASRLFQVDYSCVHLIGDEVLSPEDKLMEGIVSKDLQTSLATIPWACCFGPPYVKMITRTRICSAPFWKVEAIDSERLCCESVQDASECVTPEFKEKREAIKNRLGVEYFADTTNSQATAVVPAFVFLRSRDPSGK